MAASNLDKFLKGARKLSGNIDASGILNGTVDNFGLNSGANIPTDTGVEITVDRVDLNGAKSDKEEVICGVVSGSRIINATRGVEGNAQSHAAGAVWEMRLTASQWNKMIDGFLSVFNQDGTLKGAIFHGLTATTTIEDTDEFTLWDSVTQVLLKITGANFKAVLNSLYLSTTSVISQRINPRTNTVASHATPSINTDTTDVFTITALAEAITSMTTNLSGTPVDGQKLIIRIKDNATARAIAWGASYASRGATLPTTTVLSKYLYVGLIYNSTAAVWDCVAVSNEA